jgi:hypothetical protein
MRGERLSEPQAHPGEDCKPCHGVEDENALPAGGELDRLPDTWRDDRDDHESGEDEGQHATHRLAGKTVADDGHRHHLKGRGAEALQPADHQKLGEAADEEGGDGGGEIEHEPGDQQRLAAETVGERAVEQLAECKNDGEDEHHQLAAVLVGNAEGAADRGQRRQDDVDRHRCDSGERGAHGDELGHAEVQFRRSGCRGGGRYRHVHAKKLLK